MSSEAMPTFKPKPIHLDLYNQNDDILLRITVDRGMLGRNHKKKFATIVRTSLLTIAGVKRKSGCG